MELLSDKVKHCIEKARELAAHYRDYVLVGDHVRRSVDDFSEVCAQYLEVSLDIYEVPIIADGSSVKGTYIRFEDMVLILLLVGLDEPWQRLVLCKELFHAILDDPEAYSMEIEEHVRDCSTKIHIHDDNSLAGPQLTSEMLAEVAAMEFLFPQAERRAQMATINGSESFATIAARYGLPQYHVEAYCNENLLSQLEGLFAE